MSTPSKSKASPRVRVHVTQEIIDASTRRDSSHCMIADAIKAAVPEAAYVSVDLATIRFTDLNAGCRYVYLTPRHAQSALLAFDQGKKPEPFTVQLSGAHVLMTGSARKAKAELKQGWGSKSTPVRVGGVSPPLGPLSSSILKLAPSERRRRTEQAVQEAVAVNPEASNGEISRITGVSKNAVAKYRGDRPETPGGKVARLIAQGSGNTGRRREFGLRAIIR